MINLTLISTIISFGLSLYSTDFMESDEDSDLEMVQDDEDLEAVEEFRAIKHAIKANDTQRVRAILDAGFDVNTRSLQYLLPIHYAARRGQVENVRLLIERGAFLNDEDLAEDDHRETPPLFYALSSNSSRQIELAQLMLSNGAKIDLTDANGWDIFEMVNYEFADQPDTRNTLITLLEEARNRQN